MNIGSKIQNIRTEHGMTQTEFADKFHVSRQTVSNWENNKHYPDLDTLRKISDEYGVTLDTFLKEDQEFITHIDKCTNQGTKALIGLKIVIPMAILLLISVIAVVMNQGSLETTESVALPGIDDTNYEYPVNENGQTYGLDWMGDDYEKHAPDLIAATGVNGKTGYVKRSDLEDSDWAEVKNPDDALEYMERKNKRQGKNYYRVIPVFKKDGVTEIDQFWEYNGAGVDIYTEENSAKGNEQVVVPNLLGMTRDEAETALSAVGLILGTVDYETKNDNARVINQEPASGCYSTYGSTMRITIGVQ